jgi:hypothetical protein
MCHRYTGHRYDGKYWVAVTGNEKNNHKRLGNFHGWAAKSLMIKRVKVKEGSYLIAEEITPGSKS